MFVAATLITKTIAKTTPTGGEIGSIADDLASHITGFDCRRCQTIANRLALSFLNDDDLLGCGRDAVR